jgi:saccharopine dehydrogenase-like NADP-dependent oxidoreductase
LKLNLLELIDEKKTKFTQRSRVYKFIKHVTSSQRSANNKSNDLVQHFTAVKRTRNGRYESSKTELEYIEKAVL